MLTRSEPGCLSTRTGLLASDWLFEIPHLPLGKPPCSGLQTLEWHLAVRAVCPVHEADLLDCCSQDFRGWDTAHVLFFFPCFPSFPAGSTHPRDCLLKRGRGRNGTHPAPGTHSSDWRSRVPGWLRSARNRAPRVLEDRIQNGLTYRIGLRALSAGGSLSSGGQSASSLSFQFTLLPQHPAFYSFSH